jgi:phage FluMu protein gp41
MTLPAATHTFDLRHGYIDAEGNAHKTVVMAPATADDAIKAEAYLAAMAQSKNEQRHEANSDTMYMIALLAQCVRSLGGIPRVTVDHLRSLRRTDFTRMMNEFNALEAGVVGNAIGEAKEDGLNEAPSPTGSPS